MGEVHARRLYWSIAGTDLSPFGDATDPERTREMHETTTYHPTRRGKTYKGGNLDGTCTVAGVYDTSGVTSPKAVLEPLLTSDVTSTFIWRPEGTGTGKPQKSVEVWVSKYTESFPQNDVVRWSADLQFSGDVTISTQA